METNITLAEAQRMLQNRLDQTKKDALAFLMGDHWQDGRGFPALPPINVPQRAEIIAKIKEAFASENIIGEIIERHLDGITNREPDWQLIDTAQTDETEENPLINETEETLLEFWNSRKFTDVLRDALSKALTQEKAVVRAYIPPGFVNEDGEIETRSNLADALEMIQFEVLSADVAGVFYDKEKYQPFGIFISGSGNDKKVELTYLDGDRKTGLKVFNERSLRRFAEDTIPTLAGYIPDDSDGNAPVETDPLDLGGNLLMFELSRKSLIDSSLISLQKQVNLTWTMSGKNIYIAGSRERYFTNAQPPTKFNENTKKQEAVPLNVGGSSSTFLGGQAIYQGDGENKKLVGYANANVVVVDPVSAANFHESRKELKSAMLDASGQAHIGMSSDATASGKSRTEARAEFEKTLKRSKLALDPLGRWLMEVALRFAADITNQSDKFAKLRLDFNTIVDAGAVDAELRAADAKDVEEGRLSEETYLSRCGVEDVDAELARLNASETHTLALQIKRFEAAKLAKDLGLPAEYVVNILNVQDESERENLIVVLNTVSIQQG